uniref:Uncharacterized protein n=1 Tax=Anguilla anguilla TaxID=7936 RepID=A0A0E9SU79_ANGAN
MTIKTILTSLHSSHNTAKNMYTQCLDPSQRCLRSLIIIILIIVLR